MEEAIGKRSMTGESGAREKVGLRDKGNVQVTHRFPVVLPLISLISFDDWRTGNDCYAMTVMVASLIDKDLNLFSPTFSFITCC